MNFKRFHESKNLWDESQYNESIEAGTIVYVPVYVGDVAAVVCSTTAPKGNNPDDVMASRIIFLLAGNVSTGAQNKVNGVSINAPRAVTPINGYVTIAYRWVDMFEPVNNWKPWNHQTMLNTGSTALPYEPYSSEVWHDTPHYIHNTSTDTITTLPAVLYPNDTTATVGLKGDMSQSSQPSPTNPIQPQECGERTNNLFDVSTATLGKYIDSNGNEVTSTAPSPIGALNHTDYIEIQPNTNYTYHYKYSNGAINTIALCWFDASKNLISRNTKNVYVQDKEYTLTGTSPANAAFCIINFVGYLPNASMELSFNSGTTPLPYEPYGIKIPILMGGTTNNVYLGEVQTTRKIKKYEFTGQENFQNISADASIFGVYGLFNTEKYIPLSGAFSTHYNYISNQSDLVNVMRNNDFVMFKQTESLYNIAFKDNRYSDRTDFKTYLANQYSAGTPVTVWYVLSEPQTAVVNEPLRKIGDYADEVSGITIPTIAGANTLSIGTTLQPSEVTVNYKGWHPVQSVHERESGQWD